MTSAPDLADLFRYIDTHSDAFIERLMDYVRRPSISAHGTGIAETAEYLVSMLHALGLEAGTLPTAGWPMVLGRREDVPGATTVLLYGHYDVQPPDPLEEWLSPPFEPEIRDGKIYGRGVGDNKGQHLAQILAIESLLAVRGKLPCNLILLLEGEEEVGSPHMPEFVRDHQDDLQADLVITSDGPVHESGQACIVYGVRGVLSFDIRVKGANRDLHSGNWGGVAPQPLWRLVHLLASMKSADGEITIEGFYDDVLPQTPLELEAVRALPIDIEDVKRSLGTDTLDVPSDRPFYERLMARPTFTLNGLHGGYAGPGSKTVLPHEATVRCDMRLVEAQRADEVFTLVVEHVRRHTPDAEVIYRGAMDPSKTPIDSPFTATLRAAIRAVQGEEPLLIPALGGSLPEYAFTRTLGIPAFTVPYANPDEANHAPNENLEIDRFLKGIKTGASMLVHLGTHSPTRARMGSEPDPV